MNITSALNATNRRDLVFNAGDAVTLTPIVYAVDGDVAPIDAGSITEASIYSAHWRVTVLVGAAFTVPTTWQPRMHYRMTAKVYGVLTTLAHGVIVTRGVTPACIEDYGGAWA